VFISYKSRIIDILSACFLLAITFPLIAVIGVLLYAVYGSPVLYSEKRAGLRGREFTLYKFRTINGGRACVSESQNLIERINKNDPPGHCLGPLARIFRKYSLDELPQVLNIFLGHMAIVGPRPMPLNELHYRFGHDAFKIVSVRPGLTGLWQINGRNDLSPEERRKIDLYYVENKHPRLDCEIILKTLPAVLTGRGSY
jgi:lipopolysaccharide/colanic/teichoic acid biosynthesis glycosyltransferase